MDKRLGLVISALLLLATVQPDPQKHACTNLADLAEPCGCTVTDVNFEPICGSDGHIYLNRCFLDCRKAVDKVDITIKNIEDCTKKSQCRCRTGFDPVCGTNGITYSNECVLGCATTRDTRILLQHVGECAGGDQGGFTTVAKRKVQKSRNCSKNLKLLRYFGRSECRANNEEEPQSDRGDKDLLKPKKCLCAVLHRPVCGNDFKTYANFCTLYCASKKLPEIQMSHWGSCANTRDMLYGDIAVGQT